MPRISAKKMLEMKRSEERRAEDRAAEDARAAAPELYRTLRDALWDTEEAYREISTKQRALSQVLASAKSLYSGLQQEGLEPEVVAAGLAATASLFKLINALDENVNRLSLSSISLGDAYDIASEAFKQSFPHGF